MEDALSAGSGLALGSVAFLAVYREGFETILFYKALLTSAGPGVGGAGGGGGGATAVVGGLLVGAAAPGLGSLGLNRFGLKLPPQAFFAITSAMVYSMSFVFPGKGIADFHGP